VETKKNLPDKLEKVKFSGISWDHNNLGFFYSRYNKEGDIYKEIGSDKNHKLYYHRINTDQSEDVLIYEDLEHPTYKARGKVSDCGNFLFIYIFEKCLKNKYYYAKLDENLPIEKLFKFYPIIDNFENKYDYITNNGNQVYFMTDKDAPNLKVFRLDLNNQEPSNWVDIIPEDEKKVLSDVICVDEDKLAVIYTIDVIDQLEIKSLEDGKLLKKFEIPIGSIISFSGKREIGEIFFYFSSFLSPGIIFYYDFESNADNAKVFMEIKLKNFNASDYQTKQIFFQSKDGQVKVPLFITYHKDVKLDSTNPCLLYSYGGFGISITPNFSTNRLLFMKYFKGIYAVCNARGGNEYGVKW
jgi:prolyl oligopeptidase